MIPIKCELPAGYYIYFEAFQSALNVGCKKADIKYSIINEVSVGGYRWFLKNESDLEKIKNL